MLSRLDERACWKRAGECLRVRAPVCACGGTGEHGFQLHQRCPSANGNQNQRHIGGPACPLPASLSNGTALGLDVLILFFGDKGSTSDLLTSSAGTPARWQSPIL